MGRPPIGKTAMTSAERVRRHRQRHDTTRKLERAARQFMATGEELMRLLRESIFRPNARPAKNASETREKVALRGDIAEAALLLLRELRRKLAAARRRARPKEK
jgi:hypothetical protein